MMQSKYIQRAFHIPRSVRGYHQFQFSPTNDFSLTIDFYKNCWKHFKEGRFHILTDQLNALLSLLIKEAHLKFDENFHSFITSLTESTTDTFYLTFSKAFCDVVTDLSIESDTLYDIFKHLFSLLYTPDAIHNWNFTHLLSQIEAYCMHKPNEGKKLLDLCLKDNESFVEEIFMMVLAGCYRANRKDTFEQVREFLNNDGLSNAVIKALASFDPKNEKEAFALLRLVEGLNIQNPEKLSLLPRIYANFVNYNISDKVTAHCFRKLNTLATHESITVKQALISSIYLIKNREKEVYKIIDLLNSQTIEQNILNGIIQIFWRISDIHLFFDFLEKYALNIKLKNFKIAPFLNFILGFSKEFGVNKRLINLLIHDEGPVRFVGFEIFSRLTERNFVNFSFDILTLSPLEQIKLWVSVLETYPKPENVIPSLMPLRKSTSTLVVESFVSKLEELTENYGVEVIDALKKHLNLENNDDVNILSRVKLKYDESRQLREDKLRVKELNPVYTQARLFDVFMEDLRDNMNEMVENIPTSPENAFLDTITPITLAKSGGWMLNGRSSPLTQFSTSFRLPRLYYLQPDRFNYMISVSYSENWADKFKTWETVISSSENI